MNCKAVDGGKKHMVTSGVRVSVKFTKNTQKVDSLKKRGGLGN